MGRWHTKSRPLWHCALMSAAAVAHQAITEQDVSALALGCDILGSGGGGTTGTARLILAHHLAGTRPIELVAQPNPEAFVAGIGAYGSATLMLESLPGPAAFHQALRALERRHRPVEALLPLEVGGVNGVLAAFVAATTGLPLVDADPLGRAFCAAVRHRARRRGAAALDLFRQCGSATPCTSKRAPARSWRPVLQSLLPAVGGWGAVAAFPARAADILPHAVRGTVSHAITLGQALRRAASDDGESLLATPGVRLVFDGWVSKMHNPGVQVRGVASLSQRAGHRWGRLPGAAGLR